MDELLQVIEKFSDKTYENNPNDVKLIMGEDFPGLAQAIRSWIRQQFQNYDYYDAVAYGDLMEALGI